MLNTWIGFLFLWQPVAHGLRLEARISDRQYCEQDDGTRVARLTVTPVYSNTGGGDENLIVPRLSHVSVVSIKAGDRTVWRQRLRRLEKYSDVFWLAGSPDPALFFQLPPGGEAPGMSTTVVVPLRSSKVTGLESGSFALSLTIDHGPHSEHKPQRLPWTSLGRLVNGAIESAPVQVELVMPETFTRCVGPPVLSNKRPGR